MGGTGERDDGRDRRERRDRESERERGRKILVPACSEIAATDLKQSDSK